MALAQIVRPGAPMVYGAFTSNVDMRTGAPAFGTPESVKGAARQRPARPPLRPPMALLERDRVERSSTRRPPTRSEMAVWGAMMGGVNLLYQGAGWLEGGLTASYEKLIIDAEILQMMSEVLQPIAVDEASLGLDAIADVGPGGHFFGTAHTLERYETAFYRPLALRLAQLRDLAGGRRADRDRARQHDLEAAPRRGVPPPWTRPSSRRSTRSWRGGSGRSRRREAILATRPSPAPHDADSVTVVLR